MPSYTSVPKPTGTGYTNLNIGDKTQYNDTEITYDESTIFYDGINESAWTDVTKPSGSSYTKVAKPS